MDALMFGAMLALMRASFETWRWFNRAAPVLVLIAAGGLALPLTAALDYTWIALVFAAATALCVHADENGRSVPILNSRPLRYLGTVSYALYIWHFLLTLLIQRWLHTTSVEGLTGFALALTAVTMSALPIAAISHRYIEQPTLALKRHFPL